MLRGDGSEDVDSSDSERNVNILPCCSKVRSDEEEVPVTTVACSMSYGQSQMLSDHICPFTGKPGILIRRPIKDPWNMFGMVFRPELWN